MKISELEEEITSIKNNTIADDNPSTFFKYQIKGQQKLDSYLGFFNQSPKDVVIKEETQPYNEVEDVEYLGNNNTNILFRIIFFYFKNI
jgi:hypothetical protein